MKVCTSALISGSVGIPSWTHEASGQSNMKSAADGCTLGFSTYGMPSLKSETAMEVLAKIGFDSVELAVREGWDADSAILTKSRRKAIRHRLENLPLLLSSLMEHVSPISEKQQAFALERLKLATELAHDLSPDRPPLVQTVLGSGNFETSKDLLCDRLEQWIRLADEMQTTIAIKPHRGGIVSQPAEAVWLLEQLGKPSRLRMVYDYSHYAFRDLPLIETIETSLPYVAHVAVKDVARKNGHVVFELPGETGNIDFADLIGRLHAGGYRGDINCEVSSMVSKRPDYDSVAAARMCYHNLSTSFDRSGVRRPA